jgi:hypothetical protein
MLNPAISNVLIEKEAIPVLTEFQRQFGVLALWPAFQWENSL